MTKKEWEIEITESFSSIQGEGIHEGVPSHFLRLSKCNASCPFCDSKYSWVPGARYDYQGISAHLAMMYIANPKVNMLTISGGEPTLQDLNPLTSLVKDFYNWFIEVETNGLILKDRKLEKDVDLWIVSPKLYSEDIIKRYNQEILDRFLYTNHIFKFVIGTEEELSIVLDFIKSYKLDLDNNIWLMPKGTSIEEIRKSSKLLVPVCLRKGWNLSSRQQIVIWGNKKGV